MASNYGNEFPDTSNMSEKSIELRGWSAQDFADIYVRFYPHVLRHAKRFLTNHSQAEEITQDAFLYLMTSLPEVDSEVGVLKLLKWKTRLLALDVISANSGRSIIPLEDSHESLSQTPELSLQLERADDAAIVAMALAKIEPRQREALVASLYEEKTRSEVARQLGLSENATKQLIYRAKSAFRKALVGEAETSGLSVSEILSVAARRAASNAGRNISAASALLLVLAISIGVLPNLSPEGEVTTAALNSENQRDPNPLPQVPNSVGTELPSTVREASTLPIDEDAGLIENEDSTAPPVTSAPENQYVAEKSVVGSVPETKPGTTIRTASISPYLGLRVQQAEVAMGATPFFPNSPYVLKIHSGVGLWAYVDLDQQQMEINSVGFEIMVDGQLTFGSARSFGVATTESANGYTLTYSATELFLVDQDRNVLSDHALATSYVTITVQVDKFGNPLGANLFVTAGS